MSEWQSGKRSRFRMTRSEVLILREEEPQLMTVQCLIAQSLSLTPFYCLDDSDNVKRDVKHQAIIIFRRHSKTCAKFQINL